MRRSRLWPPKRHSYMAREGGRTLVGRGAAHNVPLPSSYTQPRCAVNTGESAQACKSHGTRCCWEGSASTGRSRRGSQVCCGCVSSRALTSSSEILRDDLAAYLATVQLLDIW